VTHYIALIHKDPDSDYGVSFPDFPGCVTAGRTMEEAREMAEEALSLHIGGMLEDEQVIPVPSGLLSMLEQHEYADAVAILVPATVASQHHISITTSKTA
jgi:predicted RNase H-like HicB family nuclease